MYNVDSAKRWWWGQKQALRWCRRPLGPGRCGVAPSRFFLSEDRELVNGAWRGRLSLFFLVPPPWRERAEETGSCWFRRGQQPLLMPLLSRWLKRHHPFSFFLTERDLRFLSFWCREGAARNGQLAWVCSLFSFFFFVVHAAWLLF